MKIAKYNETSNIDTKYRIQNTRRQVYGISYLVYGRDVFEVVPSLGACHV